MFFLLFVAPALTGLVAMKEDLPLSDLWTAQGRMAGMGEMGDDGVLDENPFASLDPDINSLIDEPGPLP